MTDQSTIAYPGSYKLRRVMLYPATASETRVAVEMRNEITSLVITESMTADSIRGQARVIERGGLLEGYPVRGEEMLFIEFEDALGNMRQYRVFVYKIDDVNITDSNDGVDYLMHFVSHQRFIADQRRITSSYNQLASKTAQDIFNNYMRASVAARPLSINASGNDGTNKQIEVEDTEGIIKIIIPRMTPVQSLKFLESRSYSTASQTCSFRFFESADSYYFATDEYMYNRALEQNKIFKMTYAPNIPQTNDFIAQRMSNFDNIRNVARVDTFDDLHGGSYRNKVLVLDIVNRVANIAEPGYVYQESRDSYFRSHQSVMDVADKHSDNFISSTFTEENERRFIMVKDYVEEDTGQLRGEQFLPQITSNRLAYFKQLNGIKIQASGPGRADITCGDFVEIVIPEFMHASADAEMNNQLSGVYMVETVSRNLVRKEYTNDYILVKRNWAREVDPADNKFLLGNTGGNV